MAHGFHRILQSCRCHQWPHGRNEKRGRNANLCEPSCALRRRDGCLARSAGPANVRSRIVRSWFRHAFDCSAKDTVDAMTTAGGHNMNRIRLLFWADLPAEFHQLRFRRAMAAMSARPIDEHRLSRECGIDRQEMPAFLVALRRAGAIAVHAPLRADYMRRNHRSRRGGSNAGTVWGFLAWLRTWRGAEALKGRGARRG